MNNRDDLGNTTEDFESIVAGIAGVSSTDGNEINEPPVEEKVVAKQDSETAEEVVEDEKDELDSILDDLTGDDEVEAGDDQEKEEEVSEETSDEEPDEGEEVLTYKYDGEEFTLTAKEVHEMKKNAGLSKKLTQEAQQNAETRKKLDSEAQAVAFAKQKPEVRALAQDIADAELAIQRGFTFDDNGQQVRLDKSDIVDTEQNIKEAREKLVEMTAPPRLDDLREAIPGLFSKDPEEVAKANQPLDDVLLEFGYSKPEARAYDDPRDILILNELLRLRELEAQVEKAKARRKDKKPAIASKTVKATGSRPSKHQPEVKRPSTQETWDKVAKGEASPADLFMDI